MRMWMIWPRILCKKHLLGEHYELHKHKHNFEKHHSIFGRVHPIVFIEPQSMKTRHDELVEEMIFRGYSHNSPYELPDLSYLPDNQRYMKADIGYNFADLFDRCPECKQRYLDL